MKMSKPFYKNGLRFQCTRCSKCCRHEPGYVFLSTEDVANLLEATSMKKKEFIKTYCRVVEINGFRRLSLREMDNYDCIFWEDDGCRIYKKRPLQCRSYPFWSHYLESLQTWNDMSKECPGVNRGEIHSQEEIQHWLDARAQADFVTIP